MIHRAVLLAVAGLVAVAATAALADLRDRSPVRTAPADLDAAPAAAAAAPASAARPSARSRPAGPEPSRAWVSVAAGRTGIPAVAVRAYARATLRAKPACGLSWTTLAGIGYVESVHGTLGGRGLDTDGRSSTLVVGPALDGTGRTAVVRPTRASSARHGDPVWDHAIGPLQFIGSTWATWGSDGDHDGARDPGDLDDAALAAARYVCADGHDLATGPGWSAAVLSYNHDPAYVLTVHAAATEYAQRLAAE